MSSIKANSFFLKCLKNFSNPKIYRWRGVKNCKFYHNQASIDFKARLKDFKLQDYERFPKRGFHTTPSKRALPPVIWVVVRAILKLTVILTGRGIRFWWKRLSLREKQQVLNTIRENNPKIWLGSFAFGGVVSFYYVSHIEEDPITKRRKFILFSEKQILEIANREGDFITKRLKNKITQSGSHYDLVMKTSQKIIKSNKHLPGVRKKWEVFIINDLNKKNAFVLPNGQIFIFTGILKFINNEDQLAMVLAHEISHALLHHSAEILSKTHFTEMLALLPVLVVWTLLPDILALSSTFLIELISTVLFRLPMNRQMELEADVVGVMMAARACYDPRQATVFWQSMENLGEGEVIEWLSTHPLYKTRYDVLQRRMPEAIKIRDQNCKKSE